MRMIALLSTLCSAALVHAVPSEFLYEAVPYVLTDEPTGDQYTVRGTFTTSCNNCATGSSLSPMDIITGFHLEVSGLTPLVFDSSAGDYLVDNPFIRLTVTPTSIQLANKGDQLLVEQTSGSGGGWFKGDFVDSTIAKPDLIQFASAGAGPRVEFPPNPDPFIVATFVPEPSSLVLSGLGCLGLFWRGRRDSIWETIVWR